MTDMYISRNSARSTVSSIISMAALCAACTVGPNFVRPTPQTPAHWSPRATAIPATPGEPSSAATPPLSKVTEQSTELRTWWRGFDDPLLSSLIERAEDSNLDLRTAVLRIDEARAQRAISAAAFWPTLSLDAAYSRERFSDTTSTGSLFNSVGTLHLPGAASISVPNPYSQYQLSADASWEIDLFGRVRRSVEAADANVQVSVEDRHAVLVSVFADVARSYLELRGAQARLRIAKENLATIEDLLELTRQRRAAGLTTYIDVSNATAQATATRAQLPAFELQITQNINQLSQLLAREPEALRGELDSPAAVPAVPPEVSIGLPAELARRRPDIREAEAALGPTLDLPIFDRGRWTAVHLYDVRAQEAALAYRRTVLNALHEVENALAAYGADQQRRTWLDATVIENRETLALSRQRYEHGIANFIDVLDAERTLQQNQLSLADSTTAVASDLVGLYRALGGGW